jgi:hypothetical protein
MNSGRSRGAVPRGGTTKESIMTKLNLTLAALAIALFGAQGALAADTGKAAPAKKPVAAAPSAADIECPPITEKSTRSRADVRAEGKAAMKAGIGKGEYDCPDPSKVSTKSRAEVKTEAAEAVKKGQTGGGEADVKK